MHRVWDFQNKNLAIPTKTHIFTYHKVTRKKSRRYKKILPFHTLNTGLHQFPHPSQPKEMNGDMRKKGEIK